MSLSITIFQLQEKFLHQQQNDVFRELIRQTRRKMDLLGHLQKERDTTVLLLSTMGSESFSFLKPYHQKTDQALLLIDDWSPSSAPALNASFSTSKEALGLYLLRVRNQFVFFKVQGVTAAQVLAAYSVPIAWLMTRIRSIVASAEYGTAWKELVAYVSLVEAINDLGHERALGLYYFSNGNFTSEDQQSEFFARDFGHRYHISNAENYSRVVTTLEDFLKTRPQSQGVETRSRDFILAMRNEIDLSEDQEQDLGKAKFWFDNVTDYITLLGELQTRLETYLDVRLLREKAQDLMAILVVFIFVLLVLVAFPFILWSTRRATQFIHVFAVNLIDKSKEIKQEKQRTDSLLYQMLPKAIVEQLKEKKGTTAEFFECVTIFFSDVVNFADHCMRYSPLHVVELLNILYRLFDDVITHYDVYKVETVNDSYMVASGLPKRNDNRHAFEIADMALEVLGAADDFRVLFDRNLRIVLRIGVNSGPCVAGVVGTKRPRYCLFGDSVNTGSRMETTGEARKIHVAESTFNILKSDARYVLVERGSVMIKGKGVMKTYWLDGKSEV